MNQLRRRINELQAKIKNLSALIEYKTREIGEHIALISDLSVQSTQFAEVSNSIQQIKKDIPEKGKAIGKIRKIVANIDAVKEDTENVRKETQDKGKELLTLHEKIGRTAFGIFKTHPAELKRHADMFAALLRLDERAESDKPKINPASQYEQSILSQIVSTARSLYSSQSYQAHLARYARAYQATGKLAVASGFRKDAQDSNLDELIDGAARIEKEIEDLGRKTENLAVKKEKYSQELISLGVKGSSFLRIRELENERKKLEITLDEKHSALGRMYVDNPNVLHTDNTEIASLLEDASALVAECAEAKTMVRKTEAQIEIDAIKEKIVKADTKIDQMEKAIRKSEEEIASQKNKIAQLEREKQKYEKIANPK
jgi:chromosome segregation ATPase